MYVDKDRLISEVAFSSAVELRLDSQQCNTLLEIMVKGFADIEFEQKKELPSIFVHSNETLMKNFAGCKKLAGINDSTIKAYLFTLRKFLEYKELPLTKVTTDDIRRYLLDYEGRASNTTVDNARRNLNSFFQFLEDENYIEKNPCKKIKHIKQPHRIQRFYTDLEMEEMRDACRNRRELAIIDFLLSTGLRVSEVASIKLTDIDWNGKTVKVVGKGKKERIVPFSYRARKHIEEYLEEGKHNGISLFCSSKSPYNGLTNDGIQKIVGNIGDRVKLEDITVHSFRKFFATNMVKKGAEPQTVKEILGHESFQTTMSYYVEENLNKAKYEHDLFAN